MPTISREVRRNSGPNGYRAARADRLAVARTARPRLGKLAEQPVLRAEVEEKLTACWSPMQISERLLVDHPGDASMRVSHETIYTSLFVQTKAVLRPELTAKLRTRRVRRRPHRRVNASTESKQIPAMASIRDRPAEASDRRTPGHWEGDLLVGRYGRSHLVTLVERHSRYLLVLPVKDATSGTVITAVAKAFARLPETMRKTLTWDRGTEMTRHAEFTWASGVPVYSATPTVPGSAAATRTRTACCASTSRRRPTSRCTPPSRCSTSSTSSTVDHAKHSNGRLHTRSSRPQRCDDRLKPPPRGGSVFTCRRQLTRPLAARWAGRCARVISRCSGAAARPHGVVRVASGTGRADTSLADRRIRTIDGPAVSALLHRMGSRNAVSRPHSGGSSRVDPERHSAGVCRPRSPNERTGSATSDCR